MDDATIKYALNDPSTALKELRKMKAERSLFDFMKEGWSSIEPSVQFVPGWAVQAICDHLQAVTDGHITRLLINIPPGQSKALPIDTPILTSYGWKKHGDLMEGDYVYNNNGLIKRVKGVTPHNIQPCYKIKFSDHVEIVAAANHLWTVERDFSETPRIRRYVTCTTTELWARNNTSNRIPQYADRVDCLTINKPIQMTEQYQLIDPYILGAWLGDGASNGGEIYCGDGDTHVLATYGELKLSRAADGVRGTKDFYRVSIKGLRTKLRVLGLLFNKHVPDNYINGSIEQRWELVRGLLDTDGNCATTEGSCGFGNNNKQIIDSLHIILNSLGIKNTITTHNAVFNGVNYSKTYRVYFRAPKGRIVFKLDRKQVNIKLATNARNTRRYIESIERVDDQVVNCIEVEDNLYLAGRNFVLTHNSLSTSVFFPAYEWARGFSHYRYINVAHEQSLAVRDNVRCRDLIQSEWYQEHWGDKFSFKSDQNQKIFYQNTETGWRQACASTSLTGRRGDRLIYDDPHSVKAADSDVQREEAIRIFAESGTNRLNDIEKSTIIIIMQRLHERDMAGHIIAKELGYEHLMLPMRFESERRCYTKVKPSYIPKPGLIITFFDKNEKAWRKYNAKDHTDHDSLKTEFRYNVDKRDEEGALLDPVRFSLKAVDDLEKAMGSWGGSYAVAGQHQQRPAPRSGGMFKKSDFQFIDSVAGLKGQVVRGWDLAASTGSKSAYTVGLKMMMTTDRRVIIMDVNRFRKTPGGVEDEILRTAIQDGVSVDISFPQDPGQAGKSQKTAFMQLLHGFNVRSSPETGSKERRAELMAAQAEGGNVYLVRGDWNDIFINEAIVFPSSEYKDQIDAMSRAYAALIGTRVRTIGAAPQLVM